MTLPDRNVRWPRCVIPLGQSRYDRETVRQTAHPYDAVNYPIPLLFGAAADAAIATAYFMSSINHDVG